MCSVLQRDSELPDIGTRLILKGTVAEPPSGVLKEHRPPVMYIALPL